MTAPKTRLTAAEWRWAIGWALAILLLSIIPYLLAILTAPPGWTFAGFLVNPQDGHSYLAKMAQGEQGNWLFHLTYTPEAHNGAYIFTFYLGLGHMARLTGLPTIVMFHLARLLAGLLLLLLVYRFIAQVTANQQERRLAYLLALTASGLGWLGVFFGAFPIDLWVPEAFIPYSLYSNPHFPLGIGLMVLIFSQVLANSRRPAALLLTALTSLALAMILPFGLLTVWAVLTAFLLWRIVTAGRRLPVAQIWLTLVSGLTSAPVIFYQYWVSTNNPILAGWSAQNITAAPPISDLLLGYGLVGGLALLGGWQLLSAKKITPAEGLVLWWAAVTLLLVYLPFFDLQRRLITGLHLPLCILAALGLRRWLAHRRLKPRRKRLLINGTLLLGAIGTLFVWLLPLLGMLQSPDESPTSALMYMRNEERAAFAWLSRHAPPEAVVLASPRVGMFLPGQSGTRVFYGHPFETLRAETRRAAAEAYFRGEQVNLTPAPDFVFYGPGEAALGQPAQLSSQTPVFSNGSVTLYKME